MKIFIAGAKGMLASDLVSILERQGEVVKGELPHFDITDPESVERHIKKTKPDIVINCAAYTEVDRAEQEADLAFAVNSKGPQNLANVCNEIGGRLIHISTDFVFNGEQNVPYKEDDLPCPLCVYGKSKLKGERLVQSAIDNHIIIRTSWLYGRNRNNFVETIAQLAIKKENVRVVYDQVGTPTYTKDIAEAIKNLLSVNKNGIYHFSNEGVCSRYDFAYEIVAMLRKREVPLKLKKLAPILSKDYQTPALRPSYTVLDKEKYKCITSKSIPHWKDGLERYFKEKNGMQDH